MKSKLFFCWLVTVLLATSCKKNDIDKEGTSMTFKCEMSDGKLKTSLSGYSVKWDDGDKIKVFNAAGSGAIFNMSDHSEDYLYAEFSGTLTKQSPYYALYSNYGESSISGSIITVSVPQYQTYVSNSFCEEGMPLVAKSEDDRFHFKQTMGILKFNLSGSGSVSKIEVTDNSGAKLWGSFTIDAESDEPVAVNQSGGSSTITLNCASPVVLSNDVPVSFHLPVPEGVFQQGFYVVITNTDGEVSFMEARASVKNCIKRGKILDMGLVTADFQPIYVLDDKIDNEPLLETLVGKRVHMQVKRTLSNSIYSTLCVPFAISDSVINRYFPEASMQQLVSAIYESSTAKYATVVRENINSLEAGMPCFIKPKEKVSNIIFYNVLIEVSEGRSYDTETATHVGIFKPTWMSASNRQTVMLFGDGKFSKATVDNYMYGLRSYIIMKEY